MTAFWVALWGGVMAHEMYHMLLAESAHGKDGVARAYHRRDELTSRKFRFRPEEITRLRALVTAPSPN